MKVFYSDHDPIPLPERHNFPAQKYQMLRERLVLNKILNENELSSSPIATKNMITMAHTTEYYDAFTNGSIDINSMRRIGLPWSPRLVNKTMTTVGGCICSAKESLSDGISGNLAGGTHHAFPDHGMGFCVFNDISITILWMLDQKIIRRAAVIDLDAHQGNGTAEILKNVHEVFTFSMHGEKSFPYEKVPSTLDIPLPEAIEDSHYLGLLEQHLPSVFQFKPDIIFYLAGVDPLKNDRYGKLGLSLEGLALRDYYVLKECFIRNIPVSLSMGGGYADPIQLTVTAHINTYQIAKNIYQC